MQPSAAILIVDDHDPRGRDYGGRTVNRRLLAALIAGAIAAVVGLVAAGPVPVGHRLFVRL